MNRIRILIACAAALAAPAGASAQSASEPSGDRTDLAALLVTWDAAEGGHYARLATHPTRVLEGEGGALVSAALFLPEGDTVATRGMIAFLLGRRGGEVEGGEVRFVWHWVGVDTVVAFPARMLPGRDHVAFAAELTELDLRFLATARSLEVSLPDGTVLALDDDVRRRLGLLARLATLPHEKRNELAALTRAIDRSIRDRRGY